MNKQYIQLNPTDWEYLKTLIGQSELKTKNYRRAVSLLELGRGQAYITLSQAVKLTIPTLLALAQCYQEIFLPSLV
jgi:hypothetical protein